MSIKVMTSIWEHFPGSGSELLCMLKFGDYSDDEGMNIYPSIGTIARQVRLSESQARRIVHSLIDDDWVQVVGNQHGGAPGASRRYQINLTKLMNTPSIHATPSTDARGSTHTRDGSHGCARRVAPTLADPSLTIINHQHMSNLKELDIFETFWERYPRKENKKKAKQAFKRLSETNQQLAIDDCSTRFVGKDKQYIPLPTTYLNGERWYDESVSTTLASAPSVPMVN